MLVTAPETECFLEKFWECSTLAADHSGLVQTSQGMDVEYLVVAPGSQEMASDTPTTGNSVLPPSMYQQSYPRPSRQSRLDNGTSWCRGQ